MKISRIILQSGKTSRPLTDEELAKLQEEAEHVYKQVNPSPNPPQPIGEIVKQIVTGG